MPPNSGRNDTCKATLMDNNPDDTVKRNIQRSCTPSQIMYERLAWAEASILANAFGK